MAVNTDPVEVDEVVAIPELFEYGLLISQSVVAQVPIPVVVVPLRAVWITTAVAERNDDKAELSLSLLRRICREELRD